VTRLKIGSRWLQPPYVNSGDCSSSILRLFHVGSFLLFLLLPLLLLDPRSFLYANLVNVLRVYLLYSSSASIPLSVSLARLLSLGFSRSVSLSVCLSLSLLISVYVCQTICLSLCLSPLSICLSLSMSLSLSLYVCISVCLSVCVCVSFSFSPHFVEVDEYQLQRRRCRQGSVSSDIGKLFGLRLMGRLYDNQLSRYGSVKWRRMIYA